MGGRPGRCGAPVVASLLELLNRSALLPARGQAGQKEVRAGGCFLTLRPAGSRAELGEPESPCTI